MPKIVSSIVICVFAFTLGACAKNVEDKNIPTQSKYLMPGSASELQQGRRLFTQQRYKESMRVLLPLACNCIAEAEYAVGFMHYNGFGVPQDTEVGTFWIRRAAQHGYRPAEVALKAIAKDNYHNTKSRQWPRGI